MEEKDGALIKEAEESQESQGEPVVSTMPEPVVDEVAIKMEDEALIAGADPDVTKDSDFDWWSKFYTSVDDEQRKQPEYEAEGYDKMVVRMQLLTCAEVATITCCLIATYCK